MSAEEIAAAQKRADEAKERMTSRWRRWPGNGAMSCWGGHMTEYEARCLAAYERQEAELLANCYGKGGSLHHLARLAVSLRRLNHLK